MTEESTISTPEAPLDDGTAFLADLAAAMKSTADRERERVAEDVDRRREQHLATINERREAEISRMEELAEDDLRSVDEWAEAERRRIQEVRERRAASVRQDLETSLAEHNAKIEREIEAVDRAIDEYRLEIERFFATLEKHTDPVAIARHASRRPQFPALERITEEANAAAGGPEASQATGTPESTGTDDNSDRRSEATDAVASTGDAAGAPDLSGAGDSGQVATGAVDATATDVSTGAANGSNGTGSGENPGDTTPIASDQSPAAGDETPPAMVGVMDQESSSKLAEAWAAWNAPTPVVTPASAAEPTTQTAAPAVATVEAPASTIAEPGLLTRVAAQADAADPTEPGDPSRRLAATYQPPRIETTDEPSAESERPAPEPTSGGSSITSMPISRPMSWLRRGSQENRDR